eukprot:5954805-Prymnesium_polylepis.1
MPERFLAGGTEKAKLDVFRVWRPPARARTTRLHSSLETMIVGTARLTGPNHEPTMYATDATPISERLDTNINLSWHGVYV